MKKMIVVFDGYATKEGRDEVLAHLTDLTGMNCIGLEGVVQIAVVDDMHNMAYEALEEKLIAAYDDIGRLHAAQDMASYDK